MRTAVFSFLLLCAAAVSGEPVVRLYKSVTLTLYEPAAARAAVVVCPGGSYCWHDRQAEGAAVGEWLQRNGVAAYVLNYRVQGIFQYVCHTRLFGGGRKYPDALDDLRAALVWVRSRVGSGVPVGAMGFSAGGHLVMNAAERFSPTCSTPPYCGLKPAQTPQADPSRTALRGDGEMSDRRVGSPSGASRACATRHTPHLDFVVPVYPVVTMRPPYCHRRSRRALLGEWGRYSRVMRDSLSLELHVPPSCPPVLLVACDDDPVVQPHNALLLDSALTAARVPHRFLRYRTGGHGFGASDKKGTPECRAWREEFLKWLTAIGY